MFLLTIGHKCCNFFIQDIFQHLGETVSRYFHAVLRVFATFVKAMIKPSFFEEIPSEIEKTKYYPWFKDCIGAIDGTHIPAVVREIRPGLIDPEERTSARRMLWRFSFNMRSTGSGLARRALLTTSGYSRRPRRDRT